MPTLHELRFTRKSDIELLEHFYHECFVPEFPNPNERETLEDIKEYLHRKETGWYGKNNYHVVVMLDGDMPIGGSISDYLVEPNAGVIEYLVVSPDHRGTGLGGRSSNMPNVYCTKIHSGVVAVGSTGSSVRWTIPTSRPRRRTALIPLYAREFGINGDTAA